MNKKKGFTIVELVIVIAVIGILSAILIPTFVGITDRANNAALQENLRNAHVAYATENADVTGLVSMEDAYLCADNLKNVSANNYTQYTIYKYNSTKKEWSKVEIESGSTLELAPTTQTEPTQYNGYYIYVMQE